MYSLHQICFEKNCHDYIIYYNIDQQSTYSSDQKFFYWDKWCVQLIVSPVMIIFFPKNQKSAMTPAIQNPSFFCWKIYFDGHAQFSDSYSVSGDTTPKPFYDKKFTHFSNYIHIGKWWTTICIIYRSMGWIYFL